jgi:4-hydroxy-tetrahydrodipicolinate synthase
MLYNIPGRTGCSIAPETVAQLMDCPNIVSFKAACGTSEEVTALRLACGSKLAIYSGDDGLTLPMVSVGAVGVVSVASHVVGPQIRAMIDAYLQGDAAVALALHEQLQPLFKALFATTNPIPVKAALQLNGWSVGDPRPPLSPLSDDMRSTLAQTMAALRQT